jgi:hypothetical protein
LVGARDVWGSESAVAHPEISNAMKTKADRIQQNLKKVRIAREVVILKLKTDSTVAV